MNFNVKARCLSKEYRNKWEIEKSKNKYIGINVVYISGSLSIPWNLSMLSSWPSVKDRRHDSKTQKDQSMWKVHGLSHLPPFFFFSSFLNVVADSQERLQLNSLLSLDLNLTRLAQDTLVTCIWNRSLLLVQQLFSKRKLSSEPENALCSQLWKFIAHACSPACRWF